MVNGTVPLLDKDGECCNEGRLDALGTCGGKCTNVDRYGNCCEVRAFTLAPQGTIVTVLCSHWSTRSQMWRHPRRRCSGHLVCNLQEGSVHKSLPAKPTCSIATLTTVVQPIMLHAGRDARWSAGVLPKWSARLCAHPDCTCHWLL
jgi:hypothetical protein